MVMMAKNGRAPGGYYNGPIDTAGECEGSGSSGRIDVEISEDSTAPIRKCINLNSDHLSFNVLVQAYPCSTMSPFERKDLASRLKAELEQVRTFKKNVELSRANGSTLSSSSDILSCSNRQNGQFGMLPKTSMMKPKSSKKLNSGTDNLMKRGWNRGTTGRFEPAVEASAQSNAAIIALMKKSETLLKRLMAHQYAWVFNSPVDAVKLNLPDYFTIIKHPMDLGTIKKKLSSGLYPSPLEFFDDVRLTFSNAMTYNPPGNDVHIMADTLNKLFESQSKDIKKKLQPINAKPVAGKPILREEILMGGSLPPTKKRKVTPELPVVISDPVVDRIMSEEQKHKLGLELESIMEDMPTNISDFLRQQSSSGIETGEDEIEIDIDALSDDTLFTLRKLLDDHFINIQKNQCKAEPCEIELLNESGLSNSSMQPCKGNEPVDEDVDVGENEPPVSSYPPVEIEKDVEHRSSNCITPNGLTDAGCDNSSSKLLNDLTASEPGEATKVEGVGSLDEKITDENQMSGNQLVSCLDHVERMSQQKPNLDDSNSHQDGGENASGDRQMSPDKLYRAALLKNRFADTILKAREKTLKEDEKGDPEKLRREKEELELQQKKEKARLQAEAKAAEDAKKRVEEEAAAEAKRKRDLEREAARQALLEMEKTVEINENARILQDLEMLRVVPTEQLPSSVDETSPEHTEDGLGGFSFGGNNPLEKLGLYMKQDDDDDDDPTEVSAAEVADDLEEGELRLRPRQASALLCCVHEAETAIRADRKNKFQEKVSKSMA
uniref:Uncharacterized protein n=1 Tax=Kalanchoe fedtschenkoi TaxID=63787 RepID=A0A7N0T552_KALFE